MSIYTLAAVRAELISELGNRTDLDTPRLNRWINDAVSAITEELDLEELMSSFALTTVAGQELYDLGLDILNIMSLSLVDPTDTEFGGYPLELMDLKWYRQQAAVDGPPTHFIKFHRILTLWPKPDAVYTLIIEKESAASQLVSDIDLLPFSPGVNSLVAIRARWFANDALGQPEAALLAQNQYATQLQMKLDKRAKQQLGRNLRSAVVRSERQLRLGDRGFRRGISRSS